MGTNNNGLRVNVLSIKAATSVKDGHTYVTVEAETDLPTDENWVKEKRAVPAIGDRGNPPLLTTMRQALDAISRRVVAENHFDNPTMLRLNGLTEWDIETYRAGGWKPFYESRGEG